ncbi:MAG: BrnA antitoxin family protein [Pseudomonadota bacterium]
MRRRRRPMPYSWSTDPVDMTQTQRIAWMRSTEALRASEYDLYDTLNRAETIPNEWHDIWREGEDRDTARTRITIKLDADVVKFFRAMGPGYQPRMNRVLRAFMYSRLARVVEGPETQDAVRDPEVMLGER